MNKPYLMADEVGIGMATTHYTTPQHTPTLTSIRNK